MILHRSSSTGILITLMGLAALALTGCGGPATRAAWHTRRGQDYLAHEQFVKARVEFRNALQISPSSAQLRYLNGVADEKLGNIREAAQYYYGAIDVNKDYTPARVALARLLVFAGLPDEALKQIAPGLAEHRDNVELLTVRAAALQEKKDPAARAEAERAVALDPKNEEATATLAGIELRAGEAESAQKLLEDALRRFPDSVQLRAVLAQLDIDRGNVTAGEALLQELTRLKPQERRYRIQLAQVYARADRLDDAERTLRAAIAALPEDEATKTSFIAFLWGRRGHAIAEAELKRMMAQAPQDLELRFTLADLYVEGGSAAKAEAIYRDLIAEQRSNAYGLRARDRLAAIYTARNDVASAQLLVKEVLQQNPADAEALSLRASEELSRGETEAAIGDLRRVLRDTPNAVNLLQTLAGAYLADGDTQLAEDAARRAVATDPANAPARIELVRVLLQAGKFAEGRTILDELHTQRPDDVIVLDLIYRAAIAQNDSKAARAAATEMITLRPEWGVGQVYLGIVEEGAGQTAEALANFRRALELQPRTTEPLKAMVGLLEHTGRFDEALRLLDQVSQRYPTDPVAPELKGGVLLAQGGHLAQAEAAYRVAVTRAPRWWLPYRDLVRLDLGRADRDGAATVLHEAADRALLAERDRVELAVLFSRTGQEEDAIRQYEEVLRRNPKSTAAAAGLALLLVSYRTDGASLSRAASLVRPLANSNDWQLLDAFGWVEFKNADLTTALAALGKAAAQRPDIAELRFHLGMVELKSGNAASAEKDLAAAVSHDAPFFGRDEAKAVLAELRSRKT